MLTVGSPTVTAQAPSPGPSRFLAAWQDSRPGCCQVGRAAAPGEQGHLLQGNTKEVWRTCHLHRDLDHNKEPARREDVPEQQAGGSPAAEPGAGEEAQRCRENRGHSRSLRGSAPRHPRALRRGQIHQAGLFKDVLWLLCKEWVDTEAGSCGGDHRDSSRTDDELNQSRHKADDIRSRE